MTHRKQRMKIQVRATDTGCNVTDEGNLSMIDEQCPESTVRIGNSLHVVYPMANGPLPCTEEFCTRTVRQKQWSHRKAKLLTYLKNAHHLIIDKANITNWCSICNSKLNNIIHIRSHPCLTGIPQILTTTEDYNRLPFKCNICKSVAYDTVVALNNHVQKHVSEKRSGSDISSVISTEANSQGPWVAEP